MKLKSTKNDGVLTIYISDRIDATTAPKLEEFIDENAQGVNKLILDLDGLTYTSSAGLRVILKAQKLMNKQGSLTIRNVQNEVMEIFEVTGFSEILTIE